MPRGPRVTQAERETILEMLLDGKGANKIAKEVKRSQDTISRIAAEYGHVFGKTNQEKADARAAYCAEARERLKLALLSEAERLVTQLRQPQEVYAFTSGGKVDGEWSKGGYQSHDLEEPEPKAKQQLLTAIGIAIDKAELIEKNNNTGNDDGRGAMLALFEAMGVQVKEAS